MDLGGVKWRNVGQISKFIIFIYEILKELINTVFFKTNRD